MVIKSSAWPVRAKLRARDGSGKELNINNMQYNDKLPKNQMYEDMKWTSSGSNGFPFPEDHKVKAGKLVSYAEWFCLFVPLLYKLE